MVTVLRYGRVGFVGSMAVRPALQGRGLGRLLLAHAQTHADAHGVTTFLLEATPAGEPLYRKLGYVVDHESSMLGKPAASGEAAPIALSDRDAIVALDREAAGCTRDVMIANLVGGFCGTVVRSEAGIAGYGLVIDACLGPVVARDRDAGVAIIAAIAGPCTTATVSCLNEPAQVALAAAGFVEQRRNKRMRRGPAVASRADWIWTYVSPGAG
jgi:hypothetical protein